MRHFRYMRGVQAVCALLVLFMALATVELRGRLITKTENGNNSLVRLLKSEGGVCDQLLFYILPGSMPSTQHNNNGSSDSGRGISKLASADEDDDNDAAEDGAGRIVAVFNGRSVKTDPLLNVTDELSLHAYLLFEWSSQQQQDGAGSLAGISNTEHSLPPNATPSAASSAEPLTKNNNETAKWSLKEVASTGSDHPAAAGMRAPTAADDGNGAREGQNNGVNKLLPEGPQAFKLDGLMKSSSTNSFGDPFNEVSSRLFYMAAVSLFKLFLTVLHIGVKCIVNDKKKRSSNDESYTGCELGLLFFNIMLWTAVLVVAAEMWQHWDDRWLCTNFRPELPSSFVWTTWLAAAIVLLQLIEMVARIPETDGGPKLERVKPEDSKNGHEQQQNDEVFVVIATTSRGRPMDGNVVADGSPRSVSSSSSSSVIV